MRKRFRNLVCRCTQEGVVSYIEARILHDMVNREVHPIRCAYSCKQKYQRALYVGKLCAEAGHSLWAMKIWRLGRHEIERKDYDDWLYVSFNTKWQRLHEVISEAECELLYKCENDLWKSLGYAEMAQQNEEPEEMIDNSFGTYYSFMWLEKYDFLPSDIFQEWHDIETNYAAEQETMRIFKSGQHEMFSC